MCSLIGNNGLELIKNLVSSKNEKTINVLTHCNAGWLATVNWELPLLQFIKHTEQASKFMYGWMKQTKKSGC